MSKILILQGSPRANGNTAWMAEEYKKAAEAAGHEVTLVNVAKKKIAGCLACEYCHNKGDGACIQKDDMQELYPLMNEAEVLVLAYDGATAEFRDICNYWEVENMGFVTAKIDEQKTKETKQKVMALANKL